MEDTWHTTENLREDNDQILSRVFSKHFLGFSNVLVIVPGTRVMVIGMPMPLLECDLQMGRGEDENAGEK